MKIRENQEIKFLKTGHVRNADKTPNSKVFYQPKKNWNLLFNGKNETVYNSVDNSVKTINLKDSLQ